MFFYLRMFIFAVFGVGSFYLFHHALLVLIGRADYGEYNYFLQDFLGKFLWKRYQDKIKNNKIKKIIIVMFMFIGAITYGFVCTIIWDGSNSPILNWTIKYVMSQIGIYS